MVKKRKSEEAELDVHHHDDTTTTMNHDNKNNVWDVLAREMPDLVQGVLYDSYSVGHDHHHAPSYSSSLEPIIGNPGV